MSVRLTRERSWVRAHYFHFSYPFSVYDSISFFFHPPKPVFSSLLIFPLQPYLFPRLCPAGGNYQFKIFLIIYSKNIQTFRRIACYTKYIRNARMFNNYPSTLFENPKILKKIAPYHLVRSFFYEFHNV